MKSTLYVAKIPDSNGYIHYTDTEHRIWKTLYNRQIKIIEARACDEFIQGVALLELSPEHIPQCQDLDAKLKPLTGWRVAPVKALISFEEFFQLLANKTFPVATFIRVEEELDYLQEPDIFHEVFGHCTMLTHPVFAAFTGAIGQLGTTLPKDQQLLLARLFWFTIEFGLVHSPKGVRIYGGGILSSKGETEYALSSPLPNRQPFDLLTAMRMPYRYDEMQLNYFVLDSIEQLLQLTDTQALLRAFEQVKQLGLLPNPHLKLAEEMRSC